jgi:hypothetical protein
VTSRLGTGKLIPFFTVYSLGGRIQLVPSFILRGGELHIIHKYLMIALIADCGIVISYWSMNPTKYKPTGTNKQILVLL